MKRILQVLFFLSMPLFMATTCSDLDEFTSEQLAGNCYSDMSIRMTRESMEACGYRIVIK